MGAASVARMSFRNSPPRQPVEPAPHRPPRLTVPAERLHAAIAERVAEGQRLLAPVDGDAEALRARRREVETWQEYNVALLRGSFDSSGPADAYRRATPRVVWVEQSLSEEWTDLRHGVEESIRRLQSVRAQLDLYEVVLDVDDPKGHVSEDGGMDATAAVRDIFVVHGHDEATKTAVARFLTQLTGREPVILHERADGGRTVIEKFEDHAEQAVAAVVLLTGDDVGGTRTGGGAAGTEPGPQQPRARQNVVLELGFFLGRLGRANVVILYEPGVELPSDLAGVLYVELDAGGAWKSRVARELKNSGVNVDLHALLLA